MILETEPLEPLTPLLRPNQLDEMAEERVRLEGLLSNDQPSWARASPEARKNAARQLKKIDRQIAAQIPVSYLETDLDNAVKRELELRGQFIEGMPTSAEMRRNPAGAVDKHRSWEARNKAVILEWKNIRLRLHAGGNIANTPVDATDVANIEMYRPVGGPTEGNLDNAQITPTEYFLPPPGSPPPVVFSMDDLELLNELAPDVRNRVIVMQHEERTMTLSILHKFRVKVAAEEAAKPEASQKRGPGRPRKIPIEH
jgi:hypothetical protein